MRSVHGPDAYPAPPGDDAAWPRLLAGEDPRPTGDPRLDLLAAILLPVARARRSGRPYVVAHLAQSLDGCIATRSGESRWLSGEADLLLTHALRALADAVLVGASTADLDDPRLTVRRVPGSHPLRVLLDPRGRVPPARRLLRDPAAPTLHLVGPGIPSPAAAPHVERVVLGAADGRFDPAAVLEILARRGVRRLLVEGGGATVSHFLEAGLVDRLHLVVAPVLVGGGRPALRLPEVASLCTCRRVPVRSFRLGEDTLLDCELA